MDGRAWRRQFLKLRQFALGWWGRWLIAAWLICSESLFAPQLDSQFFCKSGNTPVGSVQGSKGKNKNCILPCTILNFLQMKYISLGEIWLLLLALISDHSPIGSALILILTLNTHCFLASLSVFLSVWTDHFHTTKTNEKKKYKNKTMHCFFFLSGMWFFCVILSFPLHLLLEYSPNITCES